MMVKRQRYVIEVDDSDRWILDTYPSYITRSGKNLYARILIGGKLVALHRFLLNAPKGKHVDHADMNTLNNRRSNLRVCNHSENMMNRKRQQNNTSGVKGVYFHKQSRKWHARVKVNKQYISLGLFLNKFDAANAYNEAALKYHGDFARIN